MFGELAMLYHTRRTATVRVASPTVLLCEIRGLSYRYTTARAKERMLSEIVGFLSRHDDFSNLTVDEKKLFANTLVPESFEPGAVMIGEDVSHGADWMFLVQEGTVEVTDHYRNRIMLGEGAVISGQRMLYGQRVVAAKAHSQVKCLTI